MAIDDKSLSVLVTDNFPPGGGGVARYYGDLATVLGSDLTVISPWTTPELMPMGLGVKSRILQFWAALRLPRGESRVWLYGQPHLALAALLRRRPFVLFIHGGEWSGYGAKAAKAVDLIASQAVVVFANSNATAERWLPRASERGLVRVLHPGLSEEWLKAGREAAAARRSSEGARTFLAVSRLVRHKRIPELISAFVASGSIGERGAARLLVVGTGPDEAEVSRLAGLYEEVEYLGGVTDSQLRDLYAQADVFAHCPSIDPDKEGFEGYGIVYLEAAAFGLPVLGSVSGGTIEAMAPGARRTIDMDDWGDAARAFSEFRNLPRSDMEGMRETSLRWAASNAWLMRLSTLRDGIDGAAS